MILTILPEEYVTMDYLNTPNPKGIEFGKELSKLDIRSVSPALEATKPIEQLRPFIPTDLYTLYKTYTGVIVGAVFNTITKYEKGTVTHWKNEEPMKKLLSGVLTEKEIDHIYGLTFESFKTLLDLMELKIIECINRNTVGPGTTSNSLEELLKLEAVFKFNKESKGA
ncbi:hypothetical protein [Marinoscillum furvescens]|nr:hypothetical protein [Marinoscillum furvescens]